MVMHLHFTCTRNVCSFAACAFSRSISFLLLKINSAISYEYASLSHRRRMRYVSVVSPTQVLGERMKSSQVGLAESEPFWTSRRWPAPPERERPKGGEVVVGSMQGSKLSSLRCIAFIKKKNQ